MIYDSCLFLYSGSDQLNRESKVVILIFTNIPFKSNIHNMVQQNQLITLIQHPNNNGGESRPTESSSLSFFLFLFFLFFWGEVSFFVVLFEGVCVCVRCHETSKGKSSKGMDDCEMMGWDVMG